MSLSQEEKNLMTKLTEVANDPKEVSTTEMDGSIIVKLKDIDVIEQTQKA